MDGYLHEQISQQVFYYYSLHQRRREQLVYLKGITSYITFGLTQGQLLLIMFILFCQAVGG